MQPQQKIIIRNLMPQDHRSIFKLLKNKQVMQYIGPGRALSDNEVIQWINDFYVKQSLGQARRVVATEDSMLGICGVLQCKDVYDFGMYFLPEYWGQGYAFTACSIVLPQAIKQYGHHLTFFIAEGNTRCSNLAKKLDMQPYKSGIYHKQHGHYWKPAHIREFDHVRKIITI
tara:strand:- start:13656 stop:14171 length:516 start_codon:yes stop_codon:yes gene_type:complete